MKTKQVFKSYDRHNVSPVTSFRYCPRCGAKFNSVSQEKYYRLKCESCGFILYKNPYPGVVTLIIDHEKVLLGKRSKNVFKGGKWSLPGGFIEFDEDFLSAAHREIMEETGLSIKINSLISVVSNFLSPELHTLVIVLLAEKLNGEPTPGDDMVELAWFTLSSPLPDMAFEADKDIINRYYKTKIKGIHIDHRYAFS